MNPSRFNQSKQSLRGCGSHGITKSCRPIGQGCSIVDGQHIKNKTVNKLINTKTSKYAPPAPPKAGAEKKLLPRTTIIVPKKFPSETMSSEQLDILENAILSAIDKMDDGPQTRRPQFLSYSKINGMFTIECYNSKSFLWLSRKLKTLKLWENAPLKMVNPGERLVALILPKAYPKHLLSSAELTTLENEILAAIDQIPFGSFVPRFISCQKIRHSLKIKCLNLESFQWLQTTLEDLTWNGPQAHALAPDDVPALFRIQLIIPGVPIDKDVVMQRLIRQNSEININDWFFLSQERGEDNSILYMLVKQEDIDSLQNIDFKLFYNFEQIKIRNWRRFYLNQPIDTNVSKHPNSSTTGVVHQDSTELPNESTNNFSNEDNENDIKIIDDIEDS